MPRKKKVEQPDDLLNDVVNRLMDHPRTQGVLDQATSFFDDFGILLDRAARRAVQTQPGISQARYQRVVDELQAARARVEKAPPKKEDPRQVMGFGAGETLTKTAIKARQRSLAQIFHPDRGGSTEAMQRLNVAAAELLKGLG